MVTRTFPATLQTTDGRTWVRDPRYRAETRPGYVSYRDQHNKLAYHRGGRVLYSVRMTDTPTATICHPGRKIAEIATD